MRRELVQLRRDAGLTQQDVADLMGCTQQAVQKLERYDADPKLSTLRRYSNAVGALVSHEVSRDNGMSLQIAYGDATRSGSQPTSRTIQPVPFPQPTRTIQWAAESKRTDFALSA
ncbi:helix-turn-helix transcriptional regulator [Microbacterium esteraromaticum]|uniref:helix-turn-helix domain-containing protein n=1 Tax=Microbacterium esteraromaticum TaxID=57043 RepID=UPI0030A806E7